MSAYYNEIDPFAAQWLRNLIAAGHIAEGVVDCRSIEEIEPNDLKEFTQCHFFAGIGVWSHALRLAEWPDERPVWTGSCPCQPFSVAGRAGGFTDERHLWPHWHHLIKECRPGVVFGEQVASKDGLSWLDLVQADMEGEEYAIGAFDLCAAGVGAPHIRQRLYWVADGSGEQRNWGRNGGASGRVEPTNRRSLGGLGHANDQGLEGFGGGYKAPAGRIGAVRPATATGQSGGVADADHSRQQPGLFAGAPEAGNDAGRSGPTNGFWRDTDWLSCRDGKWRPVEPGTRPLANGATARVGRLRAYGNAINAYQAETFITAYLDLTK